MEFWSQVRNWWKAATNTNFAVGIYDLIFGLPNEENDFFLNQFNFILLHARYHIYNHKQSGKDKLHLYEFLVAVKRRIELMLNSAIEYKQEHKFRGKWSVF
jgi:hypothetical protein